MAQQKIQILIIDEDTATRQLIREAFFSYQDRTEIIAETDSLVYGYEMVRQNRPHLVFVDLREDPAKALETIERITTYFKNTLIVVSGSGPMDMDLMMACMQAGAREYLQRPLKMDDIVQVFEKHQMALLVDNTAGDETGRIITVFSNKGGLGKTTVAVNLALALSSVVKKPVALVDLNLQLGDITTFLDIEPKQTIVDLARNIGRVDSAYLENSLAEYETGDAKLYVLADPLNVEEAEDVTAEQINAVITVLRATFEFVVIDTTTSFDSKTLTALDLADDILLVSIVNLPCIRSSQRLLKLFDRLGYDEQKVKLIINRYLPDDQITIEDVEDTLEHPVFWKIPNAYNVIINSINSGIPITDMEGGKPIVKNFSDFAHKISGKLKRGGVSAAPQEESSGLLGGLFGKR